MLVEDFDGETEICSIGSLLEKLKTSRLNGFGAFTLSGENSTSLSIMINGNFAFLYFFPDSDGIHAGFEPIGMTPPECPESVFVMQTSKSRGDGFDIQAEHIVSPAIAYTAASEYFNKQELPLSIRWLEL